jgi:hypothetical protein
MTGFFAMLSRSADRLMAHWDGPLERTSSHVLWQINQDRPRPSAGGNLKGLVDPARQFRNVLDQHIPLCARARDSNSIRLLESVRANRTGDDLSAENNHGRSVHQSVLHGSDDVGGTRAGCDNNDTGLATCAGIALRHVAGALLVSRQDEVEVFRLVNGIENGENGTAWVSD